MSDLLESLLPSPNKLQETSEWLVRRVVIADLLVNVICTYPKHQWLMSSPYYIPPSLFILKIVFVLSDFGSHQRAHPGSNFHFFKKKQTSQTRSPVQDELQSQRVELNLHPKHFAYIISCPFSLKEALMHIYRLCSCSGRGNVFATNRFCWLIHCYEHFTLLIA